ncbi:hypothetical protein [Qipengyuania spongiae]|uniref:Uncharacterized protein n=1 Tax=Qipengyuania spongiae TaxID=2909673 RepID=A0ABY5T1U8_9SPHN|nr:hypothetical protein [Qipengyuania spongiae]UVI38914.1 hypothetical protein L1F33_11795 [Qipengyuania spongiae]
MIGAVLALAASATPGALYDDTPLTEPVLAEQRGGLRLPNGIDANLSIQTRTAIDGNVILQTVVTIDQGPPVIQIYVPKTGETIAIPSGSSQTIPGMQAVVSYNRTSGLQVTTSGAPLSAAVGYGPSAVALTLPEGLRIVDGSMPVATDNGSVSTFGTSGIQGVELVSPDLRVIHLTGSAFGSAIANSADNRAIDTQTALSIDLRNAGPDVLGSTIFRVENVTIEAMTTRF